MISVFFYQTVEAIAIGFCISNCLDALISMIPAKRLLGYGVAAQLKDLWKIMAASAVMCAVVQLMNLMNWNMVLLLSTQILAGAAVYIGLGFVLRIQPQVELLQFIIKKTKKSR
jgi:PST family polysaccharide transporter